MLVLGQEMIYTESLAAGTVMSILTMNIHKFTDSH